VAQDGRVVRESALNRPKPPQDAVDSATLTTDRLISSSKAQERSIHESSSCRRCICDCRSSVGCSGSRARRRWPAKNIVIANSNHDLEDFALLQDGSCPNGWGRLYHKWQSTPGGPYGAWALLGDCGYYLDVGRDQSGDLDAFISGLDNSIWHRWDSGYGTGWSSWSSMGGTFDVTLAPWVYSMDSNQPYMHLYGDAPGGDRWVGYQTQIGCCWSGWNPSP
jgi:hypothetical protein